MRKKTIALICTFLIVIFTSSPVVASNITDLDDTQWTYSESTQPATVAIIHFNPTFRDIEENIQQLSALVKNAFLQGANIVVAPELSTTGYLITKNDVLNGLGITDPAEDLETIKDIAVEYNGYVYMGYAELTEDNHTYNSVAIFGPDGYVQNQRKRTLPGWNERGDIELNTIDTIYGKIGTIICADSYSPDFTRILALNDADIIILPCTWWGDEGQLPTWQTRARENGVWLIVANRWGGEYDEVYDYYADMNDAPSAIISPYGNIEFTYKANDDESEENKIFLYRLTVDSDREVYSLNYRSPSSYKEIANDYYRPDMGNVPVSNLPATDGSCTMSLSYTPVSEYRTNLQMIESLIIERGTQDALVVLPGYGLTDEVIDISKAGWKMTESIQGLQRIVDENDILLLTTTIKTNYKGEDSETLLIMQVNAAPILQGQIHDSILDDGTVLHGTYSEPFYIDIDNARVGVITGRDYMFPETITALAKVGTDIILIPSDIINNDVSDESFYYVSEGYIASSLSTIISHCVHIAFSDSSGFAEVIESEWGIEVRKDVVQGEGVAYLVLDSSLTRNKYLQVYLDSDLDALLGTRLCTVQLAA